jgi:hypothetical protein
MSHHQTAVEADPGEESYRWAAGCGWDYIFHTVRSPFPLPLPFTPFLHFALSYCGMGWNFDIGYRLNRRVKIEPKEKRKIRVEDKTE